MKLSYFPQIKVIHTSKIFHGQLYVPMANWLLMIGTVLVASIYNNVSTPETRSDNLANTYADHLSGQRIRRLCHVRYHV